MEPVKSAIKLLVLTTLFLIAVWVSSPFAASAQETIRVAVMKGAPILTVEGYPLTAQSAGSTLDLASPITVKRETSGVSVGSALLRSLKITSPGVLRVNGKGYRGTIEILPAGKGLLVINELPLEEYLVGLINCEVSSQWPLEAVKAQAVVARTFALYQKIARKNMAYHLESTVYDQVYEGCDIEDSRAELAVKETRDQVLTYNGAVIQTFFHSSCGGHTEAVENVWSTKAPYLRGVECTYCISSPSVLWEQTISRKRLETILRAAGWKISGLREIVVNSRNRSGRVQSLSLIGSEGVVSIPAVAFRKLVGYGVIKSTKFEVKSVDGDFEFVGVGYGHGVGLCQWGAKQQAEEGFTYREILDHYYPGTEIMLYRTE